MKTELVEAKAKQAVKNIEDSLIFENNYDAGYQKALHNHGESLYLYGFSAGQSSPKIKQLEWIKYNNKLHRSKSMNVFFSYEIDKLSADWRLKVLLCQAEYDMLNRFNSLDEAKSAAQEDFEKRIKGCLEL